MSTTHRLLTRRTLALFRTRVPAAIPRSHLTNTCFPSFLSCRRHLSATSASPGFSSSPIPTPADSTSTSSSDDGTVAGASTPPADNRWSHILDPNNPPKLTLAHYALLNKIPARSTAASPTSQPATSPTPGLDHAIHSLQRMIQTLGTSDPSIRHDLIHMQQQLSQPHTNPTLDATHTADSDFAPTHKLRCRFCAIRRYKDSNPSYEITYTNLALLHQFINLRGMIYARKLTGNCGRHQRQLTQAVKRARVMGLLAFTSNWRLPEGWGEVEEASGGGSGSMGSGEVAGELSGMVPEQELSFLNEFDDAEGKDDSIRQDRHDATRDRR